MNVTVIANDGDADDGFVGEALDAHGARFTRVSRDDPGQLVGADAGADLLVLLGSDWSVYDAEHRRSVAAESDLVTRARAAGLPTLAICYGAQLAAHSLGLVVERAPRPEIGWRVIDSDDEHACPTGPWFELHLDRWRPDASIDMLARSEDAPQAFRVDRLFAVQFHPEVTAPTSRRWLEGLIARGMPIDLDAIDEDTKRYGAGARRSCFDLVERFLASVPIGA